MRAYSRWRGRAHSSCTTIARSVSPWLHTLDSTPGEAKYRCHWTPPLAADPFDHNSMYYGCQVIFRTTNGGTSWSVISPDLSTQDPSRNIPSGGIVGDNLGQFYGEVVFSIAPSSIEKGLIWAGTNDGLVWFTKDGGAHWNNVTKNISGLPAWGSVTSTGASVTGEAAPIVSSITLSANGNVTLDCQSQLNVASRLWATTNLAVQADWTPIFTNSAGGTWQFTDTNGLSQQKYYRLSTP